MTLVSAGMLMVAAALMAAASPATEAADVFQPSDEDVAKLAASLPASPGGFGPTIADRAAWAKLAAGEGMRAAIRKAEGLLTAPMPELTEDLYLDYSRTGNRTRGQAVIGARHGRLQTLALAEFLEAKGRFVPALEGALKSICAEKSWVLPAHDSGLTNFHDKLVTIDLGSSLLGWDVATVLWVMGDRLSPEVRALARKELQRRIFEPYRRMVSGKQKEWWLTAKMNWNSVCLAGVTGAALAALDDPKERAWYALAAEHYSRYALEGFGPDGYCDEGVGYWNYGFGHYAGLAETVRRATNGAIDLMARKEAVMPSAYGTRVPIAGGVCPAFADCSVEARPAPGLVDYLSRRFTGKGAAQEPGALCGGLCDTIMYRFPQKAPVVHVEKAWPKPEVQRTWFDHEGVYIGRPTPGSACRLSVAIQGAHNAQNHNHNDVGVFMALVDGMAVLPDIGAEVYTARTFSARRYQSRALNSWGHAVPLLAGELQRAGREAKADVLATRFAEQRDELSFDIRSAYSVPALQKMERSYVYDRSGAGSLTVTDAFAFSEPSTYEMALLTFGEWERVDARTVRVKDGGKSVLVAITAPEGTALEFAAEPVNEDLTAKRAATRIGIRLTAPLRGGTVTFRITPEPDAAK